MFFFIFIPFLADLYIPCKKLCKFLVRCFSLSSKIEGFIVRLEFDLPLHKFFILILIFFCVSEKKEKKKKKKKEGNPGGVFGLCF